MCGSEWGHAKLRELGNLNLSLKLEGEGTQGRCTGA